MGGGGSPLTWEIIKNKICTRGKSLQIEKVLKKKSAEVGRGDKKM